MKRKYLSAQDEPALTGGNFQTDPAEHAADNRLPEREEIDALRDSVANEPWQTPGSPSGPSFGEWLVRKRHATTLAGNLSATLIAALVGGPFAIVGALLAGQQGAVQIVYIILIGPIIEELLKQSGMIFLLERKPYRLFSAGQFVFAAAVSALIFATVENLMYIHVYALNAELQSPELFAEFRWTVCTALHICCAVIASLGLVRVWHRMNRYGEPADLAYGYPLFATAIVVHGLYNTGALMFSDIF